MQWEYFTHRLTTADALGFSMGNADAKAVNDMLNWYGHQGWELISMCPMDASNGGTRYLLFVFKRPVAAGSPPTLPPTA